MTTTALQTTATVSEPGIGARLAAVMADVNAVGKNRRNDQQRYAFRGIDDFSNELHPLLAKHGVVLRPSVVDCRHLEATETKAGGVMFRVSLTMDVGFVAPDGSAHVVRTVGEGCDTGDKSTNKAMSAALKYALLMTFLIPTEDRDLVDSETDSHEAQRSKAQPERSGPPPQSKPATAPAKPESKPVPAPAQKPAAKAGLAPGSSLSPTLVSAQKKLREMREFIGEDGRQRFDQDVKACGSDVAKLEGLASNVAAWLAEGGK